MLFDFTGSLNVSGLSNFTSLTISPAPGGMLTYPTTARLAITNMAMVSNVEGTPITSEFETDGDLYGLTEEEEDDAASTTATWAWAAVAFQVTLALLLHQDIYAIYRNAKVAAAAQ